MSKKSFRAALFSGKCPSCREGSIFKYPLSNITRFAEMNERCQVCEAGFEPEPGFYFGAMFITYTFNVVLLVVTGFTLYYFLDLPEIVYLFLIVLLAVLTMPFSFRLSRSLWLYWFGGLKYRPGGKS